MARRDFKGMYTKRAKTSTDDIVEELYKNVENEEKTEPEIVEEEPIMPEPVEAKAPDPVQKPTEIPAPVVKEKKKVGRPKKTDEERSIFNVKLSVSEKELLDIASSACGKSRVDYLVGLLKADYEANRTYYDSVKARIVANK